jgi:hypothetical protein
LETKRSEEDKGVERGRKQRMTCTYVMQRNEENNFSTKVLTNILRNSVQKINQQHQDIRIRKLR